MASKSVTLAVRALRALGSLLHIALSTGVLAALSYLLGWGMLGGISEGNDSPLHISYAYWLDQYFPNVPNWYPLQGGGMSLLHAYPILPHLMVVAVSRASGLTVFQSYHLISFLAFPLTALGIYFFCWLVLRRQTVGLIAGVFYLLAPITWTWMYDWGFFPQQVALVLLPWVLIAFDRAFECQVDRRKTGRGRLWFAALVLLVSLASLCHMLVGAAAGIATQLIVSVAVTARGSEHRRATMRGGAKIFLLLGTVVGLLTSAYMISFYAYGQVANREGLNTPPPHQLHHLPVLEFFGLKSINPEEILTRMQFPFVVAVLALVGLILAVLFVFMDVGGSRKALSFGIVCVAGTIYALTPALVAVVLRISFTLFNFLNFRSLLLLVMLLMPVMAGYGVWAVAYLILHPDDLPRLWLGQYKSSGRRFAFLRGSLASLAALLIAGVAIIALGGLRSANESSLAYGPRVKGISLQDVWSKGGHDQAGSIAEQLSPENWPPFILAQEDPAGNDSWRLASILPPERPLRIDVSPYMGRLAMDISTYADASQINSYTYQANIIHAMWGYQQNVFYSREQGVAESGNALTLNGLAQWFGTKFVFLNSKDDPTETYQAAGWELTHEEGVLQVWRDPNAPDMATATARPTVLVIGKPKADAYMTIFRMANDGMLPYEEALLVEGQSRVDDYAVEDLKPFDAVVLYGYDYRDGRKAWETLAEYVRQGGNLFVDTGWEFQIPEWQFDQAPEVLPLERLTWTDYGITSDYRVGFMEAAGPVDVKKFKSLEWEGKAWTVSGAQKEDVRDWGQVVLSVADKPLIVAGEYGQGRVVWSGMNLIAHARYLGQNEEEVRLLHNLLAWLTSRGRGPEIASPKVERTNPDRVDFSLNTVPGDVTWLYWREAFYPDWHAYITDAAGERETPIYRGGPGFMLMPIASSSSNATVRLVWESSLVEKAGYVASAVGLLLVVAFLLDGLFLSGNGFTWLKIAVSVVMPEPFLGHGPNLEWAEKKRAELERKHRGKGQAPTEGIPAPALVSSPEAYISEESPNQRGNRELPFEASLSDEQATLLRSWLDDDKNGDDQWADRILRRRAD